MKNLGVEPYELDVLIDALRDYAEGADRYEADDEEEANRIIGFAITARALMARAEYLKENHG